MDERPSTYHFDAFELDCANRQLRRNGVAVELGSRYLDALALLVAQPGALVAKDAFMREVWHGIPVTDEALTQCIRTLRRALGDEAASPRFIQTVPKHGYRFIAAVSAGGAPPPAEAAGEARAPVSLVAGTTTLAGLGAGVLAGLVYGILAGTGGGGQVLILSGLIGALGLLAGAGLGAGMAGAMAWHGHGRGRGDAVTVIGAALGGLCVGALGNLLGREGVGLLSGLAIGPVTGPFEGVILGTATGLVTWAVFAGRGRGVVIGVAAMAGGLAGALIHLAGGTLLAGSLHALEQGLPGAQLDLERVGALIGTTGFAPFAQGITAVAEAAVFVIAQGAGLLALRRRHPMFGAA
jgi:DNA-binding winged helix-turn-helix (wHTH) protein